MECLPDSETLLGWLVQYGSFSLFALLTLGIIALPIPEETLMIIAGVLMRKGTLGIPGTFFAALSGSICGITISYLIGLTAGHYLAHKYGKYFGLTEVRLRRVHNWFERFGKWTLFVGYFIPGVRHFTGLSAGMTELSYKQFSLFAYSGALVWVTTFLAIGYFFGNYCFSVISNLEIGVNEIAGAGAIMLICFSIFKYRR